MFIPNEIAERVFENYQEEWESVQKPLASRFANKRIDNITWIEQSIIDVRRGYRVQGVSNASIRSGVEQWVVNGLLRSPNDVKIAETIHNMANVFQRRYELSLTAKFLHFCFPDIIPPFDRYAFTSLSFTKWGYTQKLCWRYEEFPRNVKSITQWLTAFYSFQNEYQPLIESIRDRVLDGIIKKQDRALAEFQITPVDVCDRILWKLGLQEWE